MPIEQGKNAIENFRIYPYTDDASMKVCEEAYIGDTINLPASYVDPNTNLTVTRGPIGVIMLTHFADVHGELHHTESIVGLSVDLQGDGIDAFHIGHEVLHFFVGAFDPNPILNRYSEERSAQQLDEAYYPEFTNQGQQAIFKK